MSVFHSIIISACDEEQALAFQQEINHRQDLHHSIIVADPYGHRIGSGGGTMLGLLQASRILCEEAGKSDIDPEFIRSKRILVLLSGGDSRRFPMCSVGGKAFCSLPIISSSSQNIITIIDIIVKKLQIMFEKSPCGGMVVACSDVMMFLNQDQFFFAEKGVTGVAIDSNVSFGPHHGVYKLDSYKNENNLFNVTGYYQKMSVNHLKQSGSVFFDQELKENFVHLDTGIVYFSNEVVLQLISLSYHPIFRPLFSSYQGTFPRFELYTDILCCMDPNRSYEEYIHLNPSNIENISIRKTLWSVLRSQPLFALCVSGSFFHIGTTTQFLQTLFNPFVNLQLEFFSFLHSIVINIPPYSTFDFVRSTFGSIEPNNISINRFTKINNSPFILNSILSQMVSVSPYSFIENCILRGVWDIGSNCILSSLRNVFSNNVSHVQILSRVAIQEIAVSYDRLKQMPVFILYNNNNPIIDSHDIDLYIISVVGINDEIKYNVLQSNSTYIEKYWSYFYKRFHIVREDLFPQVLSSSDCSLWNAKIFPLFGSGLSKIGLRSNKNLNPLYVIHWLQGVSNPSISEALIWRDSLRLSFSDIIKIADTIKQTQWKEKLYDIIELSVIQDNLSENNSNYNVVPSIYRFINHNYPSSDVSNIQNLKITKLLLLLDNLVVESTYKLSARIFAIISDTLIEWCRINNLIINRYKKSSSNLFTQKKEAMELILTNRAFAVRLIRTFRNSCLLHLSFLDSSTNCPIFSRSQIMEQFCECVSSYDDACQLMIRETIRESISINELQISETEKKLNPSISVEARCPVRADLAGGWSDTPPITYEYGGYVINIGLLINGECPVGARVKWNNEQDTKIIFRIGKSDNYSEDDNIVICDHWYHFLDYSNLNSPAALLKSVCLCMGIVDWPSHITSEKTKIKHGEKLKDHIHTSNGLGLELFCWSSLPQGSGMGVSSILISTVISSLARLYNLSYSTKSLISMTLMVEQILSTGGGWQDQVGGILPGIKAIRSNNQLPLEISPVVLDISTEFIQILNQHLLLIYTGKQRLAKHLLQSVIFRWYQGSPNFTNLISSLHSNTASLRSALELNDLAQIGYCLNEYWIQKRSIANDAEPKYISLLMNKLRSFVYGMCLMGAGGGGYLLILTKNPCALKEIENIIQSYMDDLHSENFFTVTECQISLDGINVIST